MGHKFLNRVKLGIIPSSENSWRPEFLSGKFLIYFLTFIIVLKMLILPLSFYIQKNVFFADITKTAIVNLVNEERESLGLQSLRENSTLDKAAMLKAQDMIAKGYFSHQSPKGVSPWYWFKSAGYKYNIAGENLAIGFLDSGEVYQAWMNSPLHKANILNQNFQEIGIAVLRGDFNGNTTTIVVNLFGKPSVNTVPKILPEETPKNTIAKPKVVTNTPTAFKEELIRTVQGETSKTENTQPSFNFLNFMSNNYYDSVQKIIYVFLIFIILLLLINIFVRIDIQHPDLILKTLGFVAILVVFSMVDKITLINLIPHNFSIY